MFVITFHVSTSGVGEDRVNEVVGPFETWKSAEKYLRKNGFKKWRENQWECEDKASPELFRRTEVGLIFPLHQS